MIVGIGHWSLRAKLAASFLVLLALAMVQAAAAFRTVEIDQTATGWVDHTYKVLALADQATTETTNMRAALQRYIITGDPRYFRAYLMGQQAYPAELAALEQETADNPPQVQRWKDIAAEMAVWEKNVAQPHLDQVRTLGASPSTVPEVMSQSEAPYDQINNLYAEAKSVEQQLLTPRLADARQADARLKWILLGGMAVIAAVALGLALLLSGSIGGAFARLTRAAERFAEGRLDRPIQLDRQDEIGLTAKAFNAMAEKLQGVLGNLQAEVSQREQAEEALNQANRKLNDWVAELEQRDRESGILSEAGQLLQACMTVDEAHGVIASLLPRLFPDDPAAICVINQSGNLVEVIADSGAKPEGTQRLFAPDDCWALRLGKAHQAVLAGGGMSCPHLSEHRSAVSLCVPMVAQGKSLGLVHLALGSESSDRSFRASERLAGTLADQVGLALANLNLRETLRTQALRDPLTGLFNRRYLEESLDREISRAERRNTPLSVLMMDIDRFKQLNDTYGHQAGDEVLRQVCRVIMREIRASDLACRYGGEEFTVILPEATPENAFRRADAIRKAIAEPLVREDQRAVAQVTVSFGVAGFPDHASAAATLLQAADAALYRAKHNGRNRVEMAERVDAQVAPV